MANHETRLHNFDSKWTQVGPFYQKGIFFEKLYNIALVYYI